MLAACAVLLIVAAALALCEWIFLGRPVLLEGPPDYSAYYLFRSLALAGLAAGFVLLVQRHAQRALEPLRPIGWAGQAAILLSAAIALGATLLFVMSPEDFALVSMEDRQVESASAAALFLGSAFALLAAIRAYRASSAGAAAMLCGLAGLLFVIGMEEVSWLQREIGYPTPDWLRMGGRDEANIHNRMTNLSENVYYAGAVCFLVVLPFINDFLRPAWRPGWLGRLMPGRTSMLVAAPMAGFTWDMWNVIPIQLGVFGTLSILAAYAVTAIRTNDPARFLILIVLLATLLPLCVFLWTGDAQLRWWNSTEYKELFIALGLFSAAVEMAFAGRERAAIPEA